MHLCHWLFIVDKWATKGYLQKGSALGIDLLSHHWSQQALDLYKLHGLVPLFFPAGTDALAARALACMSRALCSRSLSVCASLQLRALTALRVTEAGSAMFVLRCEPR